MPNSVQIRSLALLWQISITWKCSTTFSIVCFKKEQKDGYLTYYLFQDDAIYTKPSLHTCLLILRYSSSSHLRWIDCRHETNKETLFRFNPVPQKIIMRSFKTSAGTDLGWPKKEDGYFYTLKNKHRKLIGLMIHQ